MMNNEQIAQFADRVREAQKKEDRLELSDNEMLRIIDDLNMDINEITEWFEKGEIPIAIRMNRAFDDGGDFRCYLEYQRFLFVRNGGQKYSSEHRTYLWWLCSYFGKRILKNPKIEGAYKLKLKELLSVLLPHLEIWENAEWNLGI